MKHMSAVLAITILVTTPCIASDTPGCDAGGHEHEWIRDPGRINIEYCSLPPKYDYICKLCGDRKVDFAPELSDVGWSGKDTIGLTLEDLRLIKTAEDVP